MHRSRFLFAGALALALVATSCDSSTDPAATVAGTEISDSAFQSELKVWANDKPASENYAAASGTKGIGGTNGATIDSAFAARTLTNDIIFEVVRQEVVKRKLPLDAVSATDVDGIVKNLAGNGTQDAAAAQKAVDALPKTFLTDLQTKVKQFVALSAQLNKEQVIADADLKKTYDADPAGNAIRCVSHILVADEATATTVESRLAKGEKFADLAKELSTDTGSKDNGGDLSDPATHSCPTISVINTTYVPEFAKGVVAAKVGVPSAPVKSQYGYHIILVTSEKTAFNDVKTSIEVAATQGNHANYWLTKAFENAKVTVNTRYGTWDAKTGVKKPTPAGTATTVAGKPAAGSTSPTSAP